ncbi:uncharacterized membrane protein YoaK (UPF0700 family) [Nitrospirillum pindoramense]|uniref:Uncharacterized membrane protein YoaK (UPF0700 family) n=1 Tax=Nitrospirillum amazonense TaxID=28077 RepID=A0A560H8P4_9PROT|nr:uncharacterized membrane protein YoaK (UPF0700 family) [Nitrospirillum amazonense]
MDKTYSGVSSFDDIPRPGPAGPLDRLRRLIAPERGDREDAQLAVALCFVAGMTNAGGFLAVGQYTSHMSGVVSGLADNLVLGARDMVLMGLSALGAFLAGAASSAILINWGRRRGNTSQYAMPLSLEAALLLLFGALGILRPAVPYFLNLAVPLLCFIMGLQNAIITKISRARIRTTHMTGMVTDIGIELGKMLYWNRRSQDAVRAVGQDGARVQADLPKLRLLSSLVGSFFGGGVLGALGFKVIGFSVTVPLALLLLLLAIVPLIDDLRRAPAPR